MVFYKLNFDLEYQQDTLLCWAAVAVSLAKYFGAKNIPSQEKLTEKVFGKVGNWPYDADKSLMIFDNLQSVKDTPLSFIQVVEQIKSGRPVVACMKDFVGWHFVVIYGIIKHDKLLIADPLSGIAEYDYNEFKDTYKKYYYWTHTYLTKPKTRTK